MDISPEPLRERYTFPDFVYYTSLCVLPFFTAFYAILNRSVFWSVFYLVVCIGAVILLYRFFCSHCPHYLREGTALRCMFFWGMPKFFQPRPAAPGFWDNCVTILASGVTLIFPLYWLFRQPGLLIIFALSLTLFLATLRRNECRRCIYLDCPVNRVPEELR